ncbi:MAG: HAD hydrolase family protein [Phycisphaerales bacterium]|nr:HAD hydrolase family protein [Phycisphaerales bacterium]
MAMAEVMVIDLDGTLVRSDGSIAHASRAALRRAEAAGLRILVATGRSWSECNSLLDAAQLHGPAVTAGGALLVAHPTAETLDRITLPGPVAAAAARSLVAADLGVLVLLDPAGTGQEYLHIGPTPLHDVSRWWHAMHGHTVHACADPEALIDRTDVLRVAAVAGADAFAGPMDALHTVLGDSGRVWHWEAVTDAAKGHEPVHLLEVFHPDATKWSMVRRWCAANDVNPAAVVAIGDGLNDVDLIRQAPLGVAMGNADPRVLAVADHVAPSNDDNGVAAIVDALLEGGLCVPT